MHEQAQLPNSGGSTATTALACLIAGLTAATAVATLLLVVRIARAPGAPGGDPSGFVFILTIFLAFGAVGGVLVVRRPRNPLGWLFAGSSLAYVVVGCARSYAIVALFVAPGTLPGGSTSAWVAAWLTIPPVFLFTTFLPLLFPTGRLPSPRWRPLAWIAAGGTASLTLVVAFSPGTLPNPDFSAVVNPFGVGGAAGDLLRALAPGLVLLPLCALAAVVSLLLRLRRARGEERQQLTWFFGAAALVAACLAGALVLTILGQPTATVLDVTRVAFLGLPLAAGVAILKYRLWDIDLLINRALVYGALIAAIAGLYALVIAGIGALFLRGDRLPLSLVAAALTAVLFQPLRERLQRGVNRFMYGERDDPYTALSRLGQRLEATLAPEAVLTTIVDTVAQALKLPHVTLWLENSQSLELGAVHGASLQHSVVRDPSASACLRAATIRTGDGLEQAAIDPAGAFGTALVEQGTSFVLPLSHRGGLAGALCLAPRAPGEIFSSADLRLLRDLASQAGAAIQAVQLTTDLRVSLEELRRSRERLVAAQEEERRRIQRDLHDGLGPTLASMRLRLEACLDCAEASSPALTCELERLDTLVGQATADIRRLVYDLRPPVLDQLGLVPALQQHVERFSRETGAAVHFTADTTLAVPAAAEVALFRLVQEALMNVQKHAHASQVTVQLRQEGDSLVLTLRDNGDGLPAAIDRPAGTGLGSMRARAETLGGTLRMSNPPGGGAQLEARIPARQ